jgi:hypothetical protein
MRGAPYFALIVIPLEFVGVWSVEFGLGGSGWMEALFVSILPSWLVISSLQRETSLVVDVLGVFLVFGRRCAGFVFRVGVIFGVLLFEFFCSLCLL